MRADPKDDNLDDLFAAARKAELYKEKREYGFETRVIARILEKRRENSLFLLWAWRLMPFFASIVICLALWISSFEPPHAADLISGAGIGNDDAVIVTYLAGE